MVILFYYYFPYKKITDQIIIWVAIFFCSPIHQQFSFDHQTTLIWLNTNIDLQFYNVHCGQM